MSLPPRGNSPFYAKRPVAQFEQLTRDASVAEIKDRDAKLRALVLVEYAAAGASGLAPDECAERLGLSKNKQSIRATTSALKIEGLLERTGERRATLGGGKAFVLRSVR